MLQPFLPSIFVVVVLETKCLSEIITVFIPVKKWWLCIGSLKNIVFPSSP